MSRESVSSKASTVAPTPSAPATSSGTAPVQAKSQLRGHGFDAQEGMLSPVQAKGALDPEAVHSEAAAGVAGAGGALPHGDAIQKSFGRHDVGAVQAHVGGAAADASRAIGASAYATGDKVAFADQPSLHTAAHEAAHVVQQRAGVQLSGGVGTSGDAYERHADSVADAVVQGRSAEGVLDSMAGGSGASSGVQRRSVQREVKDPSTSAPVTTPPTTVPSTPSPSALDTRLGTLGLTAQAATLKSGFGDEQAVLDYLDEVGDAKFADLVLTKQLSVANLKANGGAAFYKTFEGCGASTISHISQLDGIDGGSIKGCHDEDTFRGVLDEEQDYVVVDRDAVTNQPKLAPVPQKELDKHAVALEKYNKQKSARDQQITAKGSSKIPEPVAPIAPTEQVAKISVKLARGRVNPPELPLTIPGVLKLSYELRRMDNAEWRGGSQTKTTIKGLNSNSAHWVSLCNEAIWDAVRKGTFGQSWSGIAGGAQVDGYWNGGTAVDTFFFVS